MKRPGGENANHGLNDNDSKLTGLHEYKIELIKAELPVKHSGQHVLSQQELNHANAHNHERVKIDENDSKLTGLREYTLEISNVTATGQDHLDGASYIITQADGNQMQLYFTAGNV